MSNSLTIRTNHHRLEILDSYQLTPREREAFDYLDWSALEEGTDSASFFRYRGEVYDLGGFMRVEPGGDLAALGWEGHQSDSLFSGTLVRLVWEEDGDGYSIVVGRYYC